jgi:hypothetical protein
MLEQLQVATYRLLGCQQEREDSGYWWEQPEIMWEGVRDMYASITGDDMISGTMLRARGQLNHATFHTILLYGLNRYLRQTYYTSHRVICAPYYEDAWSESQLGDATLGIYSSAHGESVVVTEHMLEQDDVHSLITMLQNVVQKAICVFYEHPPAPYMVLSHIPLTGRTMGYGGLWYTCMHATPERVQWEETHPEPLYPPLTRT